VIKITTFKSDSGYKVLKFRRGKHAYKNPFTAMTDVYSCNFPRCPEHLIASVKRNWILSVERS